MANTVNTLKSRSVTAAGVARAERVRWTASMVGSALCALVAGLSLWHAPAAAAESCPNAAARQGPSIDLPECRAYEQVTPVNKGDAVDIFDTSESLGKGIVVAEGNAATVAEEGDAILVKTDGSFASQATEAASAYVFSRGAAGWKMNVLAQPLDEPQEVEEVKLFDPRDLSSVGFVDQVGTFAEMFSGQPSAYHQTALVGHAAGPYAPLYTTTGFATFKHELIEMAGGSEDLSRVVLEGEDHSLAPGAEAQDEGTTALYEVPAGSKCAAGTSNCKLIDVNEQGNAFPCGATLGHGELGEGGAHSAVSSDGSRIFFTAPEPGEQAGSHPVGVGCWNPTVSPQGNPPELYMREDGTRTVEVSAPEAGVEVGPGNPLRPVVFVGASSDGSKVFFLTRTRLTKGAVGEAPEVYEYNSEPHGEEKALTLISGGPSGTLEGNVDNVTAVSSDGSAVYFSAFGKLAERASQYPTPPKEQESLPVNLYRYDTVTGITTFITTLNNYDYPSNFGQAQSWYSHEIGNFFGVDSQGLDDEKEWYTTKDGQFLVFGTVLPLTGFDNIHAPGGKCPNNYTGGEEPQQCFELYRYDAVANKIVCVSCAGGIPVDGAYFNRTVFISPGGGTPRPISENGEDVFFESANVLVPQAVAGRVHVYEWHDGVISLISSPSDPGNAVFFGSNADGSSVFFATHAQLSPADTDQSADVYDARVDGGSAGVSAPACTGTGCQGVPAATPIFATPASATFAGVGNFSTPEASGKPVGKARVKSRSCRRGFVRKRGRCVRKTGKKSAKGRK